MTRAAASAFRVVLLARLVTSGQWGARALRDELQGLPAISADGIAHKLGLPARGIEQIAEAARSALSGFTFEAVLDQPSQVAALDGIRRAGYELALVASGSELAPERQQTRSAAELLPATIERTAASLICDGSGSSPRPVLLLEGTTVVERADRIPSWVDTAVLQPLQQRAEELQKLGHFTELNELTLQRPDTTGGSYEGRMQVQTGHFITQHVSRRTLVVHDRVFVGPDWQPGQALRIDYGQYLPDGSTVLVSHLGPSRLKDQERA